MPRISVVRLSPRSLAQLLPRSHQVPIRPIPTAVASPAYTFLSISITRAVVTKESRCGNREGRPSAPLAPAGATRSTLHQGLNSELYPRARRHTPDTPYWSSVVGFGRRRRRLTPSLHLLTSFFSLNSFSVKILLCPQRHP